MRSYKSQDEFFERMRKKPALQEILDNLNCYSEEYLATIDSQPKWIRDQLIKRKRGDLDTRSESEKRAEAERLADLMIERMNNANRSTI